MVLYYPNVGHSGGITPDLSNYYTKDEVDSMLKEKAPSNALDGVRRDVDVLSSKVDDLEGLVGGDFLIGVETNENDYNALPDAEKQSTHRLYFLPDEESKG